ncbi:MAG: DUF1376 domain-containing protein [Ramlibacter sp.]|nr:DUF1376 domain-containing protein [Ramlibacter sp.]
MTQADCDLRDFPFMPLDVVRLRDSDLAATESADAFRAAVLLWCASWHQVPAASLPDDDRVLANLAGYGRVVREWQKVREGSLRGWVLCSDNRLYHPVVADKAREAWQGKLAQRHRTECARIRKHNERHATTLPCPTFEEWMQSGCHTGQPLPVTCDNPPKSQGQGRETHSKGKGERKGQGQGQGQGKDIPPDGGGSAVAGANSSRGARLADDWEPTAEDIAFCRKERPDLSPARVGEQFRDFWIAKAGKDGTKLDWAATWRNWVRSQRVTPGLQPEEGSDPDSRSAVEAAGVECGIGQWDQMVEQWPAYKARVRRAQREAREGHAA